MKMIDTHAHLFVDRYLNDIDEVISRSKSEGIEKILLPNIDETTIDSLRITTNSNPDFFAPMMGLHPSNVTSEWKKQLDIIFSELNKNNYIAIGEIGIDLYWDKSTLSIQKKVFEEQLKWSIEKSLPVSMHSRDAIGEVIHSIKRVGKNTTFGVFHSFTGNEEELKNILSLKNYYIGINGVITFKNSGLDKIIGTCPLDRIVIETDSPWLAPTPHRGKRNEPSFLSEIVKKLSLIYEKTEKEIKQQTTLNARKIFNI